MDDAEHGLSIDSSLGRRLVAIGNKREICLYGRLTYLGCQTDPGVICTDAAYDYAVRAERIL